MKTKKTFRLGLLIVATFVFFSCITFAQNIPKNDGPINDTARNFHKKIDIGGYALNVNVVGKGSPTVIFESGSGGTTDVWRYVQPKISKITRTFSYDRAGLGKSDKSPLPRTGLNQIQELRTLLEKTEVRGPYILVANSYGGMLAKLFACLYPKEVAGIVFVDGTHESLPEYLAEHLPPFQFNIWKKMAESNPDGNYEEIFISARQVKEANKRDVLRNIPIIVLSSDLQKMMKTQMSVVAPVWTNWQKGLAALSDRNEFFIVYGSGHLIHLEKPQFVIEAIRKLIANEYDWKDPFPLSSEIIDISREKLSQFVGRYLYASDDVITINEENGHLYADIPDLPRAEMFPVSENEVIAKDVDGVTMIVNRTETGLGIRIKHAMEIIKATRIGPDYLTPKEYLVSGKTDEAIKKYKEIYKSDPQDMAVTEYRLNTLGYDLLNQKSTTEAITVFKLNTDFYPESYNVYESLAEAYIKAGNKELAIENYEKSLKLNPNSRRAENALKQLRGNKNGLQGSTPDGQRSPAPDRCQ